MATYRYMGDDDLVFDDVSDDYDLNIVMGDRFDMYRHGQKFVLHHLESPEIPFTLTLKQGRALENKSEELMTVRPDPNNPPYLLFDAKFEMAAPLYDYYNHLLFNGQCPVVKFRKTRNSKVWGMAQMEWHNRKPVYTFMVNESSMIDRVLFTNTIVHEMIHMFQFQKGYKLMHIDSQEAALAIHDNHGPQFQAEMHRINAMGFGIITEGTHAEIARESTDDFYLMIAEAKRGSITSQWLGWYSQFMMDDRDVDGLSALLRDTHPHLEFKVSLYKTKNRLFSTVTHLKKALTFTTPSLSKFHDGAPDLSKEHAIATAYVGKAIAVKLPEYKDAPDKYSLPLDRFYKIMKTYTDDRLTLRAKWMKYPLRNHNAYMEKKVGTWLGRIRRDSMSDADIVNAINDTIASYADRYKFTQYQDAMAAFLKSYDKAGASAPYHKMMRLV